MSKKLTKSEVSKRVSEKIYKEIKKDLKPLIKTHGERLLLWGLNKWIYEMRLRNSWRRQKEKAEEELEVLKKRLK